jgi:hypothetical protein
MPPALVMNDRDPYTSFAALDSFATATSIFQTQRLVPSLGVPLDFATAWNTPLSRAVTQPLTAAVSTNRTAARWSDTGLSRISGIPEQSSCVRSLC